MLMIKMVIANVEDGEDSKHVQVDGYCAGDSHNSVGADDDR